MKKKMAQGKKIKTVEVRGGKAKTTETDYGDPVFAEKIAMIRIGTGLTMSRSYQGVKIDVALEIPTPYRTEEDLDKGISSVKHKVIVEMFALKKEADELLNRLIDGD